MTKKQADPFQARQQQYEASKTRCGFCKKIYEILTPIQLKQFADAMDNPTIVVTVIQEVLDDWGIKTHVSTLHRHRNGDRGADKCMARLREAVK